MQTNDRAFFIELLSAPEIINPVPQPRFTEDEILEKFQVFIDYPEEPLQREKVVWGVYEKGKSELIGLCALLTNDEHQREIGYRFRKQYWGKGYGTEVAQHMIDYCFTELKLELITADVNIDNKGSVRILEKFLHLVREFYNERDQCTDRRYALTKEDWQKR